MAIPGQTGDDLDPKPPTNVAAYSDFTTPTSMLLTWTDPTTLINGDPITPFTIEIDRDGLNIASVASGTGTYTDVGLNDGQLYSYDVYAKLISNDSTSAAVTLSWHAGGHPVPAAPANLQATGSPVEVVLNWNDPTTQADGTPLDDLDHLNIYREGTLVGNVSPGTQTFTDVPPSSGFYNYTVTAVDNETPPNESAPSNEAGAFYGQTPDFLVWVGPGVPPGTASAASGDSLFEALLANGQSAYLTNNLFEFGTDLSVYQGVFVVLGIFANNYVLPAGGPEALALDAYVTSGGSLYLEGGDCFYYDPLFVGGHDINPWFNCVPLNDGSGDLFGVIGLNEMSAFTFAYAGENNWMDELSSGGLSSQIWQNNANADISGLYYDGWGGAAIGVVPSFGGMVSTSDMVSSQKRPYNETANQQPQAGFYKARSESEVAAKPFLKRGGYKPELAARIDRSKPLYKITPQGIEFLANNQTDLMAAYIMLMNPAPEIIYYKFNEVGGTTTQNFAAAGTPAPATANVLGLTMGGTGFEGAALIGNGLASTTNYVDTGWPTSLSGSWTISFWINDMPSNTTLYYMWGDNTAGSFRCFLGGAAGAGNLLVRGTGIIDLVITGVAPGPSQVDVVYDDALLELRAYVNGVLNATSVQTAPIVRTGTAPFKVGGYATSVGMPLNGLMDEFKIYARAIDVEPNSRDYAVTRFVDLPQFWYVGFPYTIKGMVLNEGSDNQTDVPVRLLVDGVQVGSDVLVSLISGDSTEVSFPWTPATAALTNIKIQAFLPGDQDPANDAVSSDVNVLSGAPVMTVSPSSFDVTLEPPQTQTETMTIGNVAGAGPLDFTITIEGIEAANAKVDIIAEGEARSAPIIARGREIPVAEYLQRVGAAQKSISLNAEHPEDLVEPYDQMMPVKAGNGLQKISGIGFDSPDGEEIFGSTQFSFGPAGARGRGNMFHCTSSTTLTEHRLFLNFATSTDMQFLVYESETVAGTYNLVNVSNIASSGTGQGWYSSGPISVPLVAGKYYMIYPQWTAPANYYNQQAISPYPIPASFGELIAGIGWTVAPVYSVPPPATQSGAGYVADPVAYYQTIVTGAGTSWLSVAPENGTVATGQSFNVQVTFDAANLLGGDYYGNIIVNGNDPLNLADTVSAHLFVQGAAFGSAHPDPLDFGEVFVNGSADQGLWVVNEGNGVMNVSNIISSAPEFTIAPTAFDVAPFDSVEVMVTFAPTAAGTVTGSLTVTSNATNNPFGSAVTGEGVLPPQIAPSPTEITETVAAGDTLDVPVQIENAAPAGGATLDWSASLVEGTASLRITPFIGPLSDQTDAASPSKADGKAISLILEDPWDLQVNINLETVTGALGNAGSEFDGTYFYTTRWASTLLHKIDMSGVLVEEFSISGVTGLRDLAFDGTFMYGGAAANTIFQMDFATKTLVGTIPSPVAVRHIAYDAGADGFWVGTWDTPPTLISRTGAVIATLTSGLLSQYGSAYDDYSDGGPYLWIFNQGAGAGTPQYIHQFDLNTGTATGFTHDVLAELGPNASAIAGGLWIGEGVEPGKASIGGTLQGTPDVFFAYELANAGPVWMSFDPSTPNAGSVAPGDVGGFILQLHPPTAAIYHGSVVINSNDPLLPVVTIPVEVNGTGIGEENLLPTTFAVSRNYPNPFNPTTSIDYQLPQTADVKLEIYNVLGQKVRTLINAKMAAGRYQAVWDARNDAGTPVGSGVYIYRFQAGDYKSVQKMVLMK